jgi:probable rRNA maturation factor
MGRSKIEATHPVLYLQLFNRQKTRRVNGVFWRRVIVSFLDEIPVGGHLGVHLINAKEMARLNEEFLDHTGSTDVITFDYEETTQPGELCGEMFISVDDAVACAPRFRTSWQAEMVRYLVHGVLHLQGHDDQRPAARRTMKKLENRWLKQLSLRFDWGKLARRKNGTRRK